MKKAAILASAFVYLCGNLFSQNNGNGIGNGLLNNPNALTHWKINGNNADNTHFFGTLNESDLIFKTFNTERLRIGKDGNIGIGIEQPTEKLHIEGTIKLTKDIVFSKYSDLTTTEPFRFIGIDEYGKTIPMSTGKIIATMYWKDCYEVANSDLPYADRSSGMETEGNSTDITRIPTWGAKKDVLFTASKCPTKVGIGTENPTKSLDVRGSIFGESIYSEYIKLENGSNWTTSSWKKSLELTNGGAIKFNSTTTSTFGLGASSSGDMLYFFTSNGNHGGSALDYRMVISANGNIGIGTATPSSDYKLSVNGNIRTKKVVVESDWADYVFEKEYKLMDIQSLENYIAANKHLPNVPSASEIETNGLDIGEVQKVQMEKIEELTLYIIELKKEIEALKSVK